MKGRKNDNSNRKQLETAIEIGQLRIQTPKRRQAIYNRRGGSLKQGDGQKKEDTSGMTTIKQICFWSRKHLKLEETTTDGKTKDKDETSHMRRKQQP